MRAWTLALPVFVIAVVVVAGKVVSPGQRRVPVRFEYASESDPGPYPLPANVPIEGGRDSDGTAT